MAKPGIYDHEGHVHFVTFSCYRRRRLLDTPPVAGIVISFLSSQLKSRNGRCLGFVVMPDHVHSAVWFEEAGRLSGFMQQWKRLSSAAIRRHLKKHRLNYIETHDASEPVWQHRYHDFNVFSDAKFKEKLRYMHENPVRAGLCANAAEWQWSSARWYSDGKPVGVEIGFGQTRLFASGEPR